MQYSPWILVSLAAPAFALPLAIFAYRRRHSAGAVPMMFLALVTAWWGLFQALETAAVSLEAKLMLSRIQYLAVAPAGLVWLWFSLDYTGYKRRLSQWGVVALAAIPVATILLAFTNEWHGLVWRSMEVVPGAFVTVDTEYGAWFPVLRWYSYAVTAAATILLAWYVGRGRSPYPRLVAVIGAPAAVVALNALYLSPVQPPHGVDLTPAGFAIGSVLLGWVLLRGRMLDLPPVARSGVLEQLREGVVVLDPSDRILDLNGTGRRLLGCGPGDVLPAGLRFGHHATSEASERLVRHDAGAGERLLELSVSSWSGAGARGRLLVVRDATERARMQERLESANAALMEANAELERLARTDELTSVANRKRLFNFLHDEIRRARRSGRPVCLVVVDIDHFKQVNDRHGHLVGDRILRRTAARIQAVVRDIDCVGRIGGEEFAVALPEADLEGAASAAERIRLSVEQGGDEDAIDDIRVTCSVGVAQHVRDAPVEQLFQAADAAMYRAKEAGRNRVELEPAGPS